MSDESIWEKREGEGRWYARFLLYLNMGAGRSLLGAVNLEKSLASERAEKSRKKQSIRVPGAWNDAAKQWEWRKRAQAFDEEQQRLALASTKYASVSERAKLLDRWISTQDSIMVSSVADVGYARADSMEQLRGLLDDMAKETGGRVKVTKTDATVSFDEQGAKERLMQKLAGLTDDAPKPD